MAKQLQHSDTVSGTTILDDGTKCHWTEGRSSDVVICYPGGKMERVPVFEAHPVLTQLTAMGCTEYREMTPAEEQEWEEARR